MAYYDDLSSNDYLGRWEDVLVSVGWLDGAHDYARGDVPATVFRALMQLLVDPWQPVIFASRQPCAFCQYSGGPGALAFESHTIGVGVSNLFVPGPEGKVFVAPSLVAHYIDSHGYATPEAFQRAVLECPPMRSRPYLASLLAHGLRGIRPTAKSG